MIDIDLRAHLLANADIASMIGTAIYAVRLPQDTTGTALVYEVADGYPEAQIGSMETVARHAVTINVYSPSYVQMRQLSEHTVNLLNGMTGPMGSSSVTGAHVGTALNTYDDELQLYRNIINFNIYTN